MTTKSPAERVTCVCPSKDAVACLELRERGYSVSGIRGRDGYVEHCCCACHVDICQRCLNEDCGNPGECDD